LGMFGASPPSSDFMSYHRNMQRMYVQTSIDYFLAAPGVDL
jgi:hypothetical protein